MSEDRIPSATVQLFISCSNLKRMDYMSKSDPIVAMLVFDVVNNKWVEHGRTEWKKNDHNPQFATPFSTTYYFEEEQRIRFLVYDVDSENAPLRKNDFIGLADTTLPQVAMAPENKWSGYLVNGSERTGQIHIRCEQTAGRNLGHVLLELRAEGLPKMDFFGKADPYLVFSRANEDGSYTIVHKTEYRSSTYRPSWKPIRLASSLLCNNDLYRPIRIECFDWDKHSQDDIIGSVEVSVEDMLAQPAPVFYFTNEGKKRGKLAIRHASFVKERTILDYLNAGWEMNLVVGIDFTGSNGHPGSPESLHFIHGNAPNQYESAIFSIGEILKYYDSDQAFPVFGFGAKLPNGQVSHCFPLNGTNDPHCYGIQGISQAYRSGLANVQLWGPTLFTPIIRDTAQRAQAAKQQRQQQYYILLMITDGVITDMDATIREIVAASSLPLSIIIVGVGQEDFSRMETLDSDDQLLRDNAGRTAERDIVQFVPYRSYLGKPQSLLARDTLHELPKQFLDYVNANGFAI
eukprot:gb/GECH01000254.1/.p1 GENE.gb/GECH01000254.1/~~gb/GECH01000254.1/.p1  ORF type:complete len:517 (+),score=132.10 gb/GECH01000254.1/:1-1551(+)